jgi:hypothetical protein
MSRPIDAAATEQARVRGIDDRVDLELGEVGLDNLDACPCRNGVFITPLRNGEISARFEYPVE